MGAMIQMNIFLQLFLTAIYLVKMSSFAIRKDTVSYFVVVTSMLAKDHLIQPLKLFTPESREDGQSPGTQQRLYHM